jgi:hypothetical protein
MLLAAGSVHAEPRATIRSSEISGWYVPPNNVLSSAYDQGSYKRATDRLDYMRALGYNHVVWLPSLLNSEFFCSGGATPPALYAEIPDGTCQYDGDGGKRPEVKYVVGNFAWAFQNILNAARARGMEVIPEFNTLSHAGSGTHITKGDGETPALDSTLSEFYGKSIRSYCPYGPSSNPFSSNFYCYQPDSVPSVGLFHTIRQDTIGRKKMRTLYLEYLHVIKDNWVKGNNGNGTEYDAINGKDHPSYIHLGHDELGYDRTLLVGTGITGAVGGADSRLIVINEIVARLADIESIFNSIPRSDTIGIILYGDSFLPRDYGQSYGVFPWIAFGGGVSFAGDTVTGAGGVLKAVKDSILAHGWKLELVVMPWMYTGNAATGELDDDTALTLGRHLHFSRYNQLRYLNNLGIKFIFLGGEDFGPFADDDGSAAATEYFERAKKGVYQWHNAALAFPDTYLGFENYMFKTGDKKDSLGNVIEPYCQTGGTGTICSGWTAALSAFLNRWRDRVSAPYSSTETFKNLDYMASQQGKIFIDRRMSGVQAGIQVLNQ